MKKGILIVAFTFVYALTFSQKYTWTATNSPNAGFRFEDVYFLNPDTGFAVHYPESKFGGPPGFIIRTINGGITWEKLLDSVDYAFRDIGFTDKNHGWIGTFEHSNIGADTNILYQTIDGGNTWTGVNNLPGPDTAGICGLRVINDSTIYAIGKYSGPAGFYKTNNNGKTWQYSNLDSLVSGLVDIFFFNTDTGYAVGTTGPLSYNGYGRVIYTTDAGNTWRIVHTSSHLNTMGWKVVFPSRMIGYCSLQFYYQSTTEYFLKTTDGGQTWKDIPYVGGPSNSYDVEGIGFLNDTVGWVGGYTKTYFTKNGGKSWTIGSWGNNLNRFRFLSDSLAYGAGEKIYKLKVSDLKNSILNDFPVLNNYPNPISNYAYFEFFLYRSMPAKLVVYDMKGNIAEEVFNKNFDQGNQHFVWQPKKLPIGIYMCVLTFDKHILKRKLEIVN